MGPANLTEGENLFLNTYKVYVPKPGTFIQN